MTATENEFVFNSDVPNDRIDLKEPIDIVVKKMSNKADSEFRVSLEGKNIDNSIVNAIRRTILLHIPIYGFHRSNIQVDIDKTKYMYNNDMLYNQIEMLPIYDVPNFFDLEDPQIFLPNEVMRTLFGTFFQEKFIEEQTEPETEPGKKMFNIELSINVKNGTASDKFVSSHDTVLKIDGKVSNSYSKKQPICLLVLKPGEELAMTATANLGIAKMHAIYEATTNVIIKEINSMRFELFYESLGQLDKNMIFSKACVILIKKLQNLQQFIKTNYAQKSNTNMVEIELYGEEHTLGYLLATTLQKCTLVEKAGYIMPHLFNDMVVVKYKLPDKSKHDPIEVLVDVIDYLVGIFEEINRNITTKTQ